MSNKLERSSEVRYYEQGFDLGLEYSHASVYVLFNGTNDDRFIVGERHNIIHLRDFLTKVIDGDEVEEEEDA